MFYYGKSIVILYLGVARCYMGNKMEYPRFKEINGKMYIFKAMFFGEPVYAPVCNIEEVSESTNPDSTRRVARAKDFELRQNA